MTVFLSLHKMERDVTQTPVALCLGCIYIDLTSTGNFVLMLRVCLLKNNLFPYWQWKKSVGLGWEFKRVLIKWTPMVCVLVTYTNNTVFVIQKWEWLPIVNQKNHAPYSNSLTCKHIACSVQLTAVFIRKPFLCLCCVSVTYCISSWHKVASIGNWKHLTQYPGKGMFGIDYVHIIIHLQLY